MRARYLTTTLPYVNANPHIGFALEIVQADALVRSWKSEGDDVFFLTGTDEHGKKIFDAAEKAGQQIKAYVDHYALEFRKLKELLNLSDSLNFVRTTELRHIAAAQELWNRCEENGDIELREYEGLYCVGCEAYKSARELNERGQCLLHPNQEIIKLHEKNYFFLFKKYEGRLIEYLSKPGVIVPEWRRQEAINFVQDGLEDFSISRLKEQLSWGIPVPDDAEQVMYVWFDALVSYISVLGWPADPDGNFKKFWEEGTTLQVAGKDQLRFQSLMWQAMLMSAGIKNTDKIFYHGFINSAGQKMSKSVGNVIHPAEVVKKYGIDATRYFLLRHAHPFEDTDITWERLDEWYTAHLVNGLGNLVARVMKLAETYLPASVIVEKGHYTSAVFEAVERFEFNTAMNEVWEQIQELDQGITVDEPFKVVKTDSKKGRELIAELVVGLQGIAEMLTPFMPATSTEIIQAIRENKKPENLFPRL